MVGFLNAWMLLGVLLCSIPIIIHLLNRSKFKIRSWGAMMFLHKAMQVRAQRMKIEQIILMILRSLFFVLLALALARPISDVGTGSWQDPTTHVVIIDASYSMRQGDDEDNAFRLARKSALEIVDGMRDTDNMLIVLAGNKPQQLFPNLSFDKRFLRDKIAALEPGCDQTMNLPHVLARVYWLLERSSLPRHRIYILTDGQSHGWRPDEAERWQKLIDQKNLLKVKPNLYVLEQSPGDDMRNLAVLRVYAKSPVVDVYRSTKFLVELGNYGSRSESVHVEFYADGVLCSDRDVDCPPGVHTIEFDHSFAAPSAAKHGAAHVSHHHVAAEIGEDDLVFDNRFNLALLCFR